MEYGHGSRKEKDMEPGHIDYKASFYVAHNKYFWNSEPWSYQFTVISKNTDVNFLFMIPMHTESCAKLKLMPKMA